MALHSGYVDVEGVGDHLSTGFEGGAHPAPTLPPLLKPVECLRQMITVEEDGLATRQLRILEARTSKVRDLAILLGASVLLLGAVACDGNEDLRNIERGRDTRPGIEGSPPDEGN